MSQDLAYRQLAVMILWRAVRDARSANGYSAEARVWLAGPGADLAGMIDIDPVKVRAWADGRNADKFINSREKLENGA